MLVPLKIAAAIVVFGLLIFIHETGHFLVAKLCGVRVLTYSFGFGRRLLGFKHGGTDYRISAFPFGGYVRLWGADPFDLEERDAPPPATARGQLALQDVSVWWRLAIYAAGPLANLVVPFFVFAVLLMAGEPQVASVVGTVVRDSPAAEAGLLPGDRVIEVGGEPIRTWGELMDTWEGAVGADQRVPLAVVRGDATLAVTLPAPEGEESSPYSCGLRADSPSTEIGVVSTESPAGRAGLESGDVLRTVGGQEVDSWASAAALLREAGGSVALTWDRDGTPGAAELTADEAWIPASVATLFDDRSLDRWGLETATLFVGQISKDSAAQEAGVQPGDLLLAIDGQRLGSWHEVLAGVASALEEEGEERSARPLALSLLRGAAPLDLQIQPRVVKDTDAIGRYRWRPMLGIGPLGAWAENPTVRVYYSPGRAVVRAGAETVLLVRFTVTQIVRILTREVAPGESLGGPVEIMRQATHAAERGLFDVARLAGMISISVGIFNLLPVPVLDGGNLLFYALEAVRGRPVSPLLRERAQIVGVMLLAAIMIFAFVNDFRRLFGG
ncbi:MAG: RIP metalloprotease RseP [Pseudomonadota bacterium]